MKKTILIMLISLFGCSVAFAQQSEVRELEKFSKVDLRGNVEVHLIKSNRHSIKIEIKKDCELADYITEVRNGKLFFYHKKRHKNGNDPKVTFYLEHTGITNFDLSGIVILFSENTLNQHDLTIKGDGIIKGEIDIAVKNLDIDLSGISNMKVSGTADTANLNIDGIGKINAKKLEANKVQQNADGFAKVKYGS